MPVVTFDSINKGNNVILSSDNLTATVSLNTNTVRANFGRNTGKWYWEFTCLEGSYFFYGVVGDSANLNSRIFDTNVTRFIYDQNGYKYPEAIKYGSLFKVSDVIGIALDLDNGILTFYKNGVNMGVSHTNIKNLGTVYPAISSGGVMGKTIANFGATPFLYTIPDGFMPYGDIPPINKILLLSKGNIYSTEPVGDDTKNIAPIMTSNTNGNFTVSSVSEFSTTYTPYKAFDSSSSTLWMSALADGDKWIKLQFVGNKRKVSSFIFKPHISYLGDMPNNFKFQGSNNNSTWEDLLVINSSPQYIANESREFKISNPKLFEYYRVYIFNTIGNSKRVSIAEIELYESKEIILKELSSSSEQNLIKYGMDSPVQLDGIFTSKNYILQDTISENEEGLWTTQLNRKPLSILFD